MEDQQKIDLGEKASFLISEEKDRLNDLKKKGKFNIQQSEYSLTRLSENLINYIIKTLTTKNSVEETNKNNNK